MRFQFRISCLRVFSSAFFFFFLLFHHLGLWVGRRCWAGTSRSAGRSSDNRLVPPFAVSDFICESVAYLDSKKFTAMWINHDSRSVWTSSSSAIAILWWVSGRRGDGLRVGVEPPFVVAFLLVSIHRSCDVSRRSSSKWHLGNSLLPRGSGQCSKFRKQLSWVHFAGHSSHFVFFRTRLTGCMNATLSTASQWGGA